VKRRLTSSRNTVFWVSIQTLLLGFAIGSQSWWIVPFHAVMAGLAVWFSFAFADRWAKDADETDRELERLEAELFAKCGELASRQRESST
jgi:hypothetical protein